MRIAHPLFGTKRRLDLLAAIGGLVLLLSPHCPAVVAPPEPKDAELQALGKKLASALSSYATSFHLGPAQDSHVTLIASLIRAQAVGGAAPGAHLRMSVRVDETVLQGGDFADQSFDLDINLLRAGDLWTCEKAMAQPGFVSTKSGPEVGGPPQEPINVTAAVQHALVAIGAAEAPEVLFRAAVTRWVSQNSALGADSPLGDDMGKLAGQQLKAGKDVGILLGPGLMKSGKATRVGVFCGQMYAAQYSDAQTLQAGLQPHTVVAMTSIPELRRIPPDVELGRPEFGAGPFDLGAGIKGTVPLRATRRLPEGDYVIRLCASAAGQNFSLYDHFSKWLAAKQTPVAFKFGALQDAAAKYAGPLVVFLDVCEMSDDGNGGQAVEVISRTAVMVVDVKPAGTDNP